MDLGRTRVVGMGRVGEGRMAKGYRRGGEWREGTGGEMMRLKETLAVRGSLMVHCQVHTKETSSSQGRRRRRWKMKSLKTRAGPGGSGTHPDLVHAHTWQRTDGSVLDMPATRPHPPSASGITSPAHLVPIHFLHINQDPHELGNGECWVGVIQLDGHL